MDRLPPFVSLILVSTVGLVALIFLQDWRQRRQNERDHARYVDELRSLDDDALAARVQACIGPHLASTLPAKVVERLQRPSGWTAFELQLTIHDIVSALKELGGNNVFLAYDSGLGSLSDVVNERVRQLSANNAAPAEPG